MRYLSVCSGMEAASVAWHPLGWQPVGFSEIEPFPCAILKHRFPNIPNHGSLTEHHTWPIEQGAIDLLVGGTPCQSFSVAGLRKGLADPRGNLALTFLALADRLKPRWIVWENVPGVLSSGGGRDFGSFLGALVELGYGFAYRVLDAQHFGVPQRRRRVFVVACLGDWRAAAEVLSLREGLRGYLEAGGKKRKGVAADAGASASTGCWWDGGQVSQTLGAVLDKGQTMPEKNRFPAVLQPAIPFRKSKRAASTTDNETWVPADVTNTLNNFDLGDTRTTHAVVEPVIPIHDQATRHSGKRGDNQDGKGNGLGIGNPGDPMNTLTRGDHHAVAYCSEVAPTVTSSGPPYSRTGNERVEAEALAITIYSFDSLASNSMKSSNPNSGCREVDLAKTIDTTIPCPSKNQGGLGILQTPPMVQPVAPTLTASNDPSRSPQSAEITQQVAAVHSVTMAVRRLTCVECERLQGFPDNWSRIPWKGKPETECPDGPRYKACGNSMAVPVMRWIGERIAAVEASSHA